MEAFAERLRDAVAFGAYIDGEIIGLSVFKQEDGPKDAHKAHLSGVFVEPEQRGRGVAGMLLRAVIDYGREHVEQIMLTVAEGNEAAINLYQRSARCPAPLQSPRRSAGQRDEQDRPPPETIRQRAQHRCAGKLHQRIQRQQNAIVGGDVVRVNQIAQEARQHRHNQADADSVERDSAQNYDQGSVGFHVWPPDQPPLVRLNARILYH